MTMKITDNYTLYPTAEECAAAAIKVFEKNGWKWIHGQDSVKSVPNEAQILHGLRTLESKALADGNEDESAAGRLIYYRGQFGHQKDGE